MGERGDGKEGGNREERWRGCGRRTGGRRIEIKGEGMKDGEAGGKRIKEMMGQRRTDGERGGHYKPSDDHIVCIICGLYV